MERTEPPLGSETPPPPENSPFLGHTARFPNSFSSRPLAFLPGQFPSLPLTLGGQQLAVGIRTLALALGHTCRLKPMPYFFLVEELEKLRLKALLWGQRGGGSGLRRGWDLAKSLGIWRPLP